LEKIHIDDAVIVPIREYKGKKTVILLRLPNGAQFMLAAEAEEENLSWISTIEDVVQRIHTAKIQKVKKEISASERFLVKLKEQLGTESPSTEQALV
jgi:hypothetical protein